MSVFSLHSFAWQDEQCILAPTITWNAHVLDVIWEPFTQCMHSWAFFGLWCNKNDSRIILHVCHSIGATNWSETTSLLYLSVFTHPPKRPQIWTIMGAWTYRFFTSWSQQDDTTVTLIDKQLQHSTSRASSSVSFLVASTTSELRCLGLFLNQSRSGPADISCIGTLATFWKRN